MAAQSVRLIAFTPLLLNRYSNEEVAAWLLFGSILFLGVMLVEQSMLVSSRMIAMAMGGAEDLSPIRPGESPRGKGEPNWPLVERVYGCVGGFNLVLGIVFLVVSMLLGLFSLNTRAIGGGGGIWIAFSIMVFGDVIRQLLLKNIVVLRGMGRVALANRWSAVFAVASTIVGTAAILLNASLAGLAIAVQVVNIAGTICLCRALWHVEPRVARFKGWAWDPQIMRWSAAPFAKSLVQSLANRGALKIGTILFVRYGQPGQVAGLLLAIRLFETVAQVAVAPLSSNVPQMVRLYAQGDLGALLKRVSAQFRVAQILQVAGALALLAFGPFALEAVGSSVSLPRPLVLQALGTGFVFMAFIRQSLMLSLIGNNVVAVRRMLASLALSAALCYTAIQAAGDLGVVIAIFAPQIVCVNFRPFKLGANALGCRATPLFGRAVMPAWIAFAAGALAAPVIARAIHAHAVPALVQGWPGAE